MRVEFPERLGLAVEDVLDCGFDVTGGHEVSETDTELMGHRERRTEELDRRWLPRRVEPGGSGGVKVDLHDQAANAGSLVRIT